MCKAHAIVHAGICGFVTEVTASGNDDQEVTFTITSPCANIQRLAAALPADIDAYSEIGTGYAGIIWTAAHSIVRGNCSGCIVAPAIFKAMQVAAGLALPAESVINIERVGEDTTS